MIRLTNREIDEIANAVIAKLKVDDEVDMMQEVIEGDKAYLTPAIIKSYSGLDMTPSFIDIMTRFPHYDKDKGMLYGSRHEWNKITPNTTVQSSDIQE
jgi:L-fucose mutarotase/ribose pyranase (RbsD/FucU family)